jgi:hypothetical protein
MRNDFLHVIEQLAAQYKSDARGDETIAALARRLPNATWLWRTCGIRTARVAMVVREQQ